jgi:hypothetical protein
MNRAACFFCWMLVCFSGALESSSAASAESWFQTGVTAYNSARYDEAARAFEESARLQLGSGTLQNWGNAEWKANRPGAAILAWEQSLWMNPFHDVARSNLRFARKQAQLEAPELKWFEVVSSWLPAGWWAWLAGVSLWLAVAIISLPGLLGRPRTSWHQAVAAIGFMVFLLSIPAHFGVTSRARIGLVLEVDTPLRLTPTAEAQIVTRLPAGQPARYERRRGDYLLIRAGTHGFRGWVDQKQFGLICR